MWSFFSRAGVWLLALLPQLLTTIAVYLGIGMISYQGVGAVLDIFEGIIKSSLGGLPTFALAVLSIAKVDEAISMILSAVSIKLTFKGLQGAGQINKLRFKLPF